MESTQTLAAPESRSTGITPTVELLWFVDFWWHINDSPKPEFSSNGERLFLLDPKARQDGESPWVVTVGKSYLPLYMAARLDLWSWDGSRAKFVRQFGDMIT